ncbi:hypothetical protein K461DRAFT_175601 [Myriangium duriaei CBS 260.36]|uniref:Uncharacterized protein n=1 Tax=Myriangium duriaei CBS 260.36 TaxID=1168546 RepID=A0A9P4IXG7_9PEZI|nr:hypothetical protein K461DRAFT_175601 [Myriangium duriaei CBS 260.36]
MAEESIATPGYSQRGPHSAVFEPFRLLDLPPEIKDMIYKHAWKAARNDMRILRLPGQFTDDENVGDEDTDDEDSDNEDSADEDLDDDDTDGGSTTDDSEYAFKACSDLWALSRTSKEINAQVLPLVYRDITWFANVRACGSRGSLKTFSPRVRFDLVTHLCLTFDFGEGFGRHFGSHVMLLSEASSLTYLSFRFRLEDDTTEESVSDQVDLACLCWQHLQFQDFIPISVPGHKSIAERFGAAELNRWCVANMQPIPAIAISLARAGLNVATWLTSLEQTEVADE